MKTQSSMALCRKYKGSMYRNWRQWQIKQNIKVADMENRRLSRNNQQKNCAYAVLWSIKNTDNPNKKW